MERTISPLSFALSLSVAAKEYTLRLIFVLCDNILQRDHYLIQVRRRRYDGTFGTMQIFVQWSHGFIIGIKPVGWDLA